MFVEYKNINISIDKKGKVKNLPFLLSVEKIKNEILGFEYELEVNFIEKTEAKKINKKYRGKDYIPNTLSFPYSPISGEIFLQLETIFEQAPDFDLSEENHLIFIFIHSLFHLKGLDHGPKMEKLEQKMLKKYLI